MEETEAFKPLLTSLGELQITTVLLHIYGDGGFIFAPTDRRRIDLFLAHIS